MHFPSIGLATAGILFLVGSSDTIAQTQEGRVKVVDLKVEPFTAIDVGDTVQVVVKVGDRPSLRIAGDERVVAIFESSVESGVLRLRAAIDEKLHPPMDKPWPEVVAEVVVVRLDRIKVTDAARVEVQPIEVTKLKIEAERAGRVSTLGLKAEQVDIDLTAAAIVKLEGKAGRIEMKANGASRVEASGLDAEQARVRSSQAAMIEVRASESLEVKTADASMVRVFGEPKKRDVSTKDGGLVR